MIECALQIVFLIPKCNGKFRGIGILEVIWKEVSGVVNVWIWVAVDFHDTLHGFSSGRVMMTTSLEANLLHKLT